jgi:hypothetical protein
MSLISVVANEAPSDMWNMSISQKITHLAYMTFNKTIKIINKNKNHIIILAKNRIVQIGKINIKVMLLKKN